MIDEKTYVKRVVIAGCRDYKNYEQAKEFIDLCLLEIKNQDEVVIVSGGASGADAIGERYAKENGMKVEKYPAEWKKYGRRAGPMRNEKMAKICDCVICFWDEESWGTKSMIDQAKKYGKQVKIKIIEKMREN